MAARATHSASRAARRDEAVATGPLGALSHDELGVIFDGLADPLEPVVAVALSSTCLGLRTPMQAALKVLKGQHLRAAALCHEVHTSGWPCSCAALRDEAHLAWAGRVLFVSHMKTLGMLLRTNGLSRLQTLDLSYNYFGDVGMQALCEGMGRAALPSLITLRVTGNIILKRDAVFGPVGAEALAAALIKGAMPTLEHLSLGCNPIGKQGIAALVAPLRKLRALKELFLYACDIGDEGAASLVANVGKDDFKELKELALDANDLTDTGCITLATALKGGVMPGLKFGHLDLEDNHDASDEARRAVNQALLARSGSSQER